MHECIAELHRRDILFLTPHLRQAQHDVSVASQLSSQA
jgi:hypothetical protein